MMGEGPSLLRRNALSHQSSLTYPRRPLPASGRLRPSSTGYAGEGTTTAKRSDAVALAEMPVREGRTAFGLAKLQEVDQRIDVRVGDIGVMAEIIRRVEVD